jgi:hypothetical protein
MIAPCVIFFSAVNCFSQSNNQIQNHNNPEFSRLYKDQDGLISCTEMQTYQPPFTKADLSEMKRTLTGWYSKLSLVYYNYPH